MTLRNQDPEPPTSRSALLKEHDYRSWFFSQILSSAGLQTQNIGAAWLIYVQTHSGLALAMLIAASQGPGLLTGLLAGTVVDRLGTRKVLLCSQFAALLVSGALGAVTLFEGSPHLAVIYALSIAAGVVNAFDSPARQLIVMHYVGFDRLPSAIGLYEVGLSLARIAGPALGGVLLATSGPAVCFLFNAASFVPPLVVLARYRPRFALTHDTTQPRLTVRDAVRVALTSPPIRTCLLFALIGTTLTNTAAYFPQFASETLELPSSGYGALVACMGVGALPGAVLATRLGRSRRGHRIAQAGAATGVATMLTGIGSAPVAFVGAVLCGASSICLIALANTVTQLSSPNQLRGGIMGAWTMMLPGMSPITGLAVGAIADHWGPRWVFVVVGCCFIVLTSLSRTALRRSDEALRPA